MQLRADMTVAWPPGVKAPPLALRWGMAPAVQAWSGRTRLAQHATLQGVSLEVTLVFELGELVRIELRGALDGFALAALGCSEETLDDVHHHRLQVGGTRVMVDALDGLIALEPEDL